MTTASRPATGSGVRLAELLAVLSLGTDLGMGQPMEHVLRQCLISLRLAQAMGLDAADREVVFYAALLAWVGCHVDAYEQARWFGDDQALKADFRLVDFGSAEAEQLFADLDSASSWDAVIGAEPALGARLAEPDLDAALAAIAVQHHERLDGSGYPRGLAKTGTTNRALASLFAASHGLIGDGVSKP